MKNKFSTTRHFDFVLSKIIKKNPKIMPLLFTAVTLLDSEFQAQSLKVHKLSGDMSDCWAFSLTYGLRVIFKREKDIIILTDIGSHDEVY